MPLEIKIMLIKIILMLYIFVGVVKLAKTAGCNPETVGSNPTADSMQLYCILYIKNKLFTQVYKMQSLGWFPEPDRTEFKA